MDNSRISEVKFFKTNIEDRIAVTFVYAGAFRFNGIYLILNGDKFHLKFPKVGFTDYYYFSDGNYNKFLNFLIDEYQKQQME